MKLKLHFFSSNNIFIFSLVLYLLGIFLKINIIQIIFGLPLLLFFPGYFLSKKFSGITFGFDKYGIISLNFIYSFILCGLFGLISQNLFGFSSNYQIGAILVLNLILFALSLTKAKEKKKQKTSPFLKSDIWALILFAVLLIIPVIISPLAQNADNYLALLSESLKANNQIANIRQIALNTRQMYLSYLALGTTFLKINTAFFFRNIFILLFYFFSLSFFSFLGQIIKNKPLQYLLLFSIFAPSVILIELNIIRPQAGLIILTLPILILLSRSLIRRDIFQATAALALSVFAFSFHELSIILIILSLSIVIYLSFSSNKINLIYKLIIGFSLICSLAALIYFLKDPILYLFKSVFGSNKFSFRWWFLDNYQTTDEQNLSWRGIGALFYYLYNGILVLLLLIYILMKKYKEKICLPVFVYPATFYFLFYLLLAEVLPRFGFFFLPNRAYIHMMLAVIIIFAVIVANFKAVKFIKLISGALIVVIVVGYTGALYVSANNVNEIYKGEIGVSKYIKGNLSADDLLVSSQDNSSLANVYLEHSNFLWVKIDHRLEKDEFEKILQKEMNRHKYAQGKKYKKPPSVYLLYSFEKLKGFNQSREYRKTIIDLKNKDTYGTFGYEEVYKDQGIVLYKIK